MGTTLGNFSLVSILEDEEDEEHDDIPEDDKEIARVFDLHTRLIIDGMGFSLQIAEDVAVALFPLPRFKIDYAIWVKEFRQEKENSDEDQARSVKKCVFIVILFTDSSRLLNKSDR